MKRALVIGIDDYPEAPLKGCVNDAIEMKSVLQTLGNGDPNFSVRALTSQDGEVTSAAMHEAVEKLFNVRVKAVNTLTVKGQTRSRAIKKGRSRVSGREATVKKAIVTLFPGQRIDIFEQV